MASGIGHYIHFYASDYLKHGINDPKDSQGYRSRYQDLYEIREEIKTNSSYKGRGEKAWELEQKLNSFYIEPHILPSGENYDKELEEYLLSVIGDVTDNITLNIGKLEATYNTPDLY